LLLGVRKQGVSCENNRDHTKMVTE
jgi:hypothetical protein